jgi:hypothetical protein
MSFFFGKKNSFIPFILSTPQFPRHNSQGGTGAYFPIPNAGSNFSAIFRIFQSLRCFHVGNINMHKDIFSINLFDIALTGQANSKTEEQRVSE